jgi:Flp pilus assembly pilin Flp
VPLCRFLFKFDFDVALDLRYLLWGDALPSKAVFWEPSAFQRLPLSLQHRRIRQKRLAGFKVWRDQHGQDLIEYALMAGFVAVATGATFPPAANAISQIFSKVSSVMSAANNAS